MFSLLDAFLNRTTMYRLALYETAGLLAAAVVLSTAGVLPFSPVALAATTILLLLSCWFANAAFARAFGAPSNPESTVVTALILALILPPLAIPVRPASIGLALCAGSLAMAAKYLLAIDRKHLFNPAAAAVAVTAAALNFSADWWIGTAAMLPFVLAGGFLLVRKIRRWTLVLSFAAAAVLTLALADLLAGADPAAGVGRMLVVSPLFFFASVMLTEPLTTPPTAAWQAAYGALVGILFAPTTHLGPLYFTPELALLAGNVFSYAVSPKRKLRLRLRDIRRVADGTYDFVFTRPKGFAFRPGQYLEWTLAHARPDQRGSRRFFTISSAPTEDELRMGVKFYPGASTYKKKLAAMEAGDVIVASQLSGDFTLPRNPRRKLAFVAGGIGITPFRSMAKTMADRRERRDATLLYACRTEGDIAYRGVFDEAKRVGLKTVYTLTDPAGVPADWNGRTGRVDAAMIRREVPDFRERVFYVSGTARMVADVARALRSIGVPRARIRTDYFPGFA